MKTCPHGNIESNCTKCKENARYRDWYREPANAAKVSVRHRAYYLRNRDLIAGKNAAAYARRKAAEGVSA